MKDIEQQRLPIWSPGERKCLFLLQQKSNITRASLLQIHAFILRNALQTNTNLLTKFIATCFPLAGIHHARCVFDQMPKKDDAFLCNTMIRAHLETRQFVESITLYRQLRRHLCFSPDNYTFSWLAKSCGLSLANREGQQIHNHVTKTGFGSNLFTSTSLVDMYAKFGVMS